MPRTIRWTLLALFASALAAAAAVHRIGAPVSPAAGVHADELHRADDISSNWGGYVAAAADTATPLSFTTISAHWVQPKVNCSVSRAAYSAFWVGLGGSSDTSNALEQIGTEADCSASGKASYEMWYEVVPAPSVSIKLKVVPGNSIAALVRVSGTTVSLTIQNLTRRTKFTKTVRIAAPDTTSAEWVAEAPSICRTATRCTVLPLANFGAVRFTNAAATVGGHTGTVSDPSWASSAITLVTTETRTSTATGQVVAVGALPSELSPEGGAFSVAYSGAIPVPEGASASR